MRERVSTMSVQWLKILQCHKQLQIRQFTELQTNLHYRDHQYHDSTKAIKWIDKKNFQKATHTLFQHWNTFPKNRPILKLELQHFQMVWMAILKLHKTPTPNTPIRRQPFFFFLWPFGCHYILFLRLCLDKCHGSRQINLVCFASLSFYLFLYLLIPSINPSTNP